MGAININKGRQSNIGCKLDSNQLDSNTQSEVTNQPQSSEIQVEHPKIDVNHFQELFRKIKEEASKWNTEFVRTEVEEAIKGIGQIMQQILEKNKEMEAKIKWLEKSMENQGIVLGKLGEKILTDQDRHHIGQEFRKNDIPSPTPVRREDASAAEERGREHLAMDIDGGVKDHPADDCPAAIEEPNIKNVTLGSGKHGNNPWEINNHFQYLRTCWYEQIGLPIANHQQQNI